MVLEMIASPIAGWLSGIAAPLTQMFGDALTVSRNGNMVCWGYDGQSAVIEMTLDGLLCATFIDCERLEAVSALPAVAAYRTGATYTLTPPDGRRSRRLFLGHPRTTFSLRRRIRALTRRDRRNRMALPII
jgi:hypothetical protein